MTGTIFLVLGNSRSFCLIRDETGQEIFAPKDNFKDPAIMLKGANVRFRLVPGKPRPRAEDVEAA